MAEATYVYVISGDHGRQKIGSTNFPPRRIKELQTGSPFRLRFEFVGEVAECGAGAVEVNAHFVLNQHKAPGGDESFVVPPDVAVTAVMAAAHRLGYRIRPVDPYRLPEPSFGTDRPAWSIVLGAIVMAGLVVPALAAFDRGTIGGVSAVVITAAALWLFGIISRRAPVLVDGIRQLIAG